MSILIWIFHWTLYLIFHFADAYFCNRHWNRCDELMMRGRINQRFCLLYQTERYFLNIFISYIWKINRDSTDDIDELINMWTRTNLNTFSVIMNVLIVTLSFLSLFKILCSRERDLLCYNTLEIIDDLKKIPLKTMNVLIWYWKI